MIGFLMTLGTLGNIRIPRDRLGRILPSDRVPTTRFTDVQKIASLLDEKLFVHLTWYPFAVMIVVLGAMAFRLAIDNRESIISTHHDHAMATHKHRNSSGAI